jgi:type IV fimbrial biogenesis protein FimT
MNEATTVGKTPAWSRRFRSRSLHNVSRKWRHGARRWAGVSGFSMLELMVSMAVLALLAAVAGPNMAAFVNGRRVEDVARRLAADMNLARNEALKRNASVLLCATASGTACKAAPTAADWARGWRVCFDADNDNDCDAGTAADANPVRVQPSINSAVTLTGPASRLRFNADGTVTASAFTDFIVSTNNASATPWRVRFAASGATSARKV